MGFFFFLSLSLTFAKDMPSLDYCGFVVGEKQDEAILYGKAAGTGFLFAGAHPSRYHRWAAVLHSDLRVSWVYCRMEAPRWRSCASVAIVCLQLADLSGKVTEVAIVRGKAKNILIGERTALNLIGMLLLLLLVNDGLIWDSQHGAVASLRVRTSTSRLQSSTNGLAVSLAPERLHLALEVRSVLKNWLLHC